MCHPALCLVGPELLWAAQALRCPDLDNFQSNFEEQWAALPHSQTLFNLPHPPFFLTEHGTENLLKPSNQEAISVLSSGGQEADQG